MDSILTSRKKRGLSPILATVVLIGITVAAGGALYTMFQGSTASAGTSNTIRVESISAVKGSSHADFTVTVTNAGSVPWKSMEVWVSKEATSRPILYEELHEMAVGASETDTSAQNNIKNSLRVEAIGTLSDGFGVGLGRKFVVLAPDQSYSSRDVAIAAPSSFAVGTDNLTELDTKWKGIAGDCSTTLRDFNGDGTNDPGCKVKTGMKLAAPIGAGESFRFYADILLEEPQSLSSDTENVLTGYTAGQLVPVTVNVGDSLVVNIKAVGVNGEETQSQAIVRITGA